jgi:hypothetical protein
MTRRLVARGLIVALLAISTGCAQRERDERPQACPELDAGKPVDPTLLAFLSRARAAHHLADGHEEGKDPARAVKALEALIAGPIPGAPRPAPEVREVLADTRARIADLESQRGNFDLAMKQVDEGLRLADQPSYFRGHLYEIRGLVEERRAKQLREQGNAAGAEQSKQRALEAFEESMKIQERVIKDSVPTEKRP